MALPSHTPATWDDILSTTFHNYRKQLTDNIFESRPLLNFYMSNNRLRTVSGGISIVEPIIYAEGEFKAYTEWESVSVEPQVTATAAQFPWKQLVSTIAISGLEEAQNNSKEAIVNLLEAKIMQAEETMKSNLNRMLCTLYNSASDAGNDRVDAIFTNAYGFEFYESTLTPQVRYTDVEKANLGFQNLMFKNVPIFWDFDCSGGTEGTTATNSATFYGLNSKYVGLCVHSDRNFKQSPFTDNLSGSFGASTVAAGAGGAGTAAGESVDARVSFITTYGNQTTRNRRRLFKLTGVTEA